MQFRRLSVPDAYEFSPRAFPDERGLFVAPFQETAFREAVGHPMRLGQTNHSVSRRGALRGIHFADTPPGQGKYIYCPRGSMLDIVVDLRVGSPTFGKWDALRLDSTEYRAIYIAEGLGHGFIALEDDTVMSYLCSEPYTPSGEHGISPLDPALDLPWPAGIEPVLSGKDRTAPTLAEARDSGLLPLYSDCVAYYDKLRSAN
ncbi:dTDP-4-dehydrorhamnose 3,5-epimerase [Amycolatopsis balhimycina DSM 5908]|uniref:dTDP-4-dehydrorhamnose 3,5-epimerase n=1 Tax=Amycolatopsis balhimycina DSM 5908 TaxID=1081091 RepID=A0A428X2R1_AMYBA|nr:dTDP-4-dehydrorhamnose 3,5-epimerase [Amycolatopsis balhimycina]RSM49623.1 dTDP-4-dehydrorhamnose 3,5-epimerase [Amycolatopsis balhimycina DSM 5908]